MGKPPEVGPMEAGVADAVLAPKFPSEESPASGVGKIRDIEAGALYPKMKEDPKVRWAFIRKVYAILSIQFLFTAGIASLVSFVRPIPRFLLSGTPASWTVFFLILVSPLIAIWPMLHYRKRHPINIVFLAIYTLLVSFVIGMACVTVSGKVALQAVILSATVVIGLTLYTFWAARRGHDFAFLYPFLFASLLVLLAYSIMQFFFPLSRLSHTIYGCLSSVVFSGFIIFDTDNMIKRHEYSEYIAAAISLYLDVINLFMSMLTLSSSVN